MKMGDDEFAVETLVAASSNQTTQYPATIKPLQDIDIRPQVSGFIVKLCVDEGATVRRDRLCSRLIRHSIRLHTIRLKQE